MSKPIFETLNPKLIIKSIERVFFKGDIDYLTKQAYAFIILYMGFIAHYDLHGFRETYRNKLETFADNLQTGESHWQMDNLEWADYIDKDFNGKEVSEWTKTKSSTIRSIVNIARGFSPIQ